MNDRLRQIIGALQRVDRNVLDPVRGFLGVPQYYTDQRSVQMPANMMRPPEARQSMGRFGELAHNPQVQSMRVPAAAKTDRIDRSQMFAAQEAQRQAAFEQQKQAMSQMYPSQGQMERASMMQTMDQPQQDMRTPPSQDFSGVTSDQVAEALPKERKLYEIQSGDTLSRIAQRNGTTVEALAQANGIKDPNRIYAGASLIIPG
jgi:nucleoid-associated protein YgaU